MKTRVLLTGGKGSLASYIPKVFTKDKFKLLMMGKDTFDVTSKKKVFKKVTEFRPDVVIHLAALTNVDECEKNPKKCFMVNAEGTRNIAEACKKIGSLLIYMSTSAVFAGRKKGYFENDKPNPVNVYAKAKLKGEEFIKKNLKRFYIVRAGWIIGGGKREKKFISIIIKLSKKDKEIKVAKDKFGTIVYARDLAKFFRRLSKEKDPYGVYHFGTRGICSRLDIAKEVFATIKRKVKIVPADSSEFLAKYPAPRPDYEILKSKKIKFSKTWRKSLREYLLSEII